MPQENRYSEGLKFERVEDGYELVGLGSCKDKAVVIPPVCEGLPVVSIATKAFHNRKRVVSVVIPDGVTYIDDLAFFGCDRLEHIDMGNGIVHIGYAAFENCPNLLFTKRGKALYLGNESNPYVVCVGPYQRGVRSYALESCPIHKDTRVIYYDAFNGFTGLAKVKIPKGVLSIGQNAFYICESLKEVYLPDGLLILDAQAFCGCDSLTTVRIPHSLNIMETEAFSNCPNLTTIQYDGTIEEWDAIEKVDDWDANTVGYTIYCTDGDIVTIT